jgi:hypothetical protein
VHLSRRSRSRSPDRRRRSPSPDRTWQARPPPPHTAPSCHLQASIACVRVQLFTMGIRACAVYARVCAALAWGVGGGRLAVCWWLGVGETRVCFCFGLENCLARLLPTPVVFVTAPAWGGPGSPVLCSLSRAFSVLWEREATGGCLGALHWGCSRNPLAALCLYPLLPPPLAVSTPSRGPHLPISLHSPFVSHV